MITLVGLHNDWWSAQLDKGTDCKSVSSGFDSHLHLFNKGTIMAASMHNFILSYHELNLIQSTLKEKAESLTDENSIRSLETLSTKLREQRDKGYPAMDYPFWKNPK